MEKSKNETDLFEQFSNDSTDREQKEAIKKMLSEDKEFAANYNDFSLLTDGIKYSARKKMMDKIKLWDRQMSEPEEKKTKVKNTYFRWYYIAAVLGFFVLVFIGVFDYLRSSNNTIVAQYYQPYEYIPSATRGETDDNANKEIFNYYDKGEYLQTIKMINNLNEKQKSDETDFILANAYQATDKYENAIEIYNKLANSDSRYASGSNWYLALCYLSINQKEMAKEILEKLQTSKTSYAPKAASLFSELD